MTGSGSRWDETLVYSGPKTKEMLLNATPGMNLVRDVAREIVAAISGISALGPSEGVLWRGQSDVEYAFASTLARKASAITDHPETFERKMIEESKRAGIEFAHRYSDAEVLAQLRHHGAATRLIDVTSDPFVALWFACTSKPESDGVIFAVDRGQLNRIERVDGLSYDDLLSQGDLKPAWYSLGQASARISAQRGSFIFVHELDPAARSEIGEGVPASWASSKLDKVCNGQDWSKSQGRPVEKFPMLFGVRIPAAVKKFMEQMLARSYGLARSSLFPDFAGMGNEYSLEPRK